MNFANLIDGQSAAIVCGGTMIATVLRAGIGDCRQAASHVLQLGRARFDAAAARSELAQQVQEILRDGLLRAVPHNYHDSEFDEATGALIEGRSLVGLLAAHERHKAKRLSQSSRAVNTLALAADLAPVFGLAGTLVSLSQLPQNGLAQAAIGSAISMAVLTTLYGLLAANLLFAPLSRAVERRALAEERDRQDLVDWLSAQLAETCPAKTRRGNLDGNIMAAAE